MLKIATWNVNSIRKRIEQVCSFIINNQIDIILLQEIRCTEEQFPYAEIKKLKYECAVYGQIARNGVCILSRYQIFKTSKINFVEEYRDSRYIECKVKFNNQEIIVGSIYIPNGHNPDSSAFEYKLKFFDNLYKRMAFLLKKNKTVIIAGDYNVAPNEIDVFDPILLNGQICFHIKERKKLNAILDLGFKDAFRISNSDLQQFTWWNYQGNSLKMNRGMRIDHILISPQIVNMLKTCYIDSGPRKSKNPSDHAPVVCVINQNL
ncbi:MAG: exodeoxyribonuclease III [Wolbachia endosymbiont of Menacanthus eurysternus]|nr:MAG: exodeoxyribonuclease III [Wolbachia endosymbiont of Menacanthus eurysternus]